MTLLPGSAGQTEERSFLFQSGMAASGSPDRSGVRHLITVIFPVRGEAPGIPEFIARIAAVHGNRRLADDLARFRVQGTGNGACLVQAGILFRGDMSVQISGRNHPVVEVRDRIGIPVDRGIARRFIIRAGDPF